jgi:hypothetical protein
MSLYQIKEINYNSQKFIICELNNINKDKIKYDYEAIYDPPDYKLKRVRDLYYKISKYNSYTLNHYTNLFKVSNKNWVLFKPDIKNKDLYLNFIMNNYFKNEKPKYKLFINLTYTCDFIEYIKKETEENANYINDFFKNDQSINQIIYNPRYKISGDTKLSKSEEDFFNPIFDTHIRGIKDTTNAFFLKDISVKNKQDFIFFRGGLEYFHIKSLSYYTEQIHYMYFFFQIYYILTNQNKNGSFIIKLNSIIDTHLGRSLIRFIKKYYKNLYLVRDGDNPINTLYIIGKNFEGVNKIDLKLLKKLFKNIYYNKRESSDKFVFIFGEELNVFNDKLRSKKNVVKHFVNFVKNIYLFKLIKFDKKDILFDKIIDKFNNKICNYILKNNNLYKIPKKYKNKNLPIK